MKINLYNNDCMEQMKKIEDESVDLILCDLPYGTTECKWDIAIPFDKLFEQYNRIVKMHGCIALFGQEPFSSKLRMSNLKYYHYDWIWEKTSALGFLNANKMPLRSHENISIFYKKLPVYNPQFTQGKPYKKKASKNRVNIYNKINAITVNNTGNRYPKDVLLFPNCNYKSLHPTQKPVDLLEYLIKTYTNEGDLVLDNCMGSGSTGVACVNTKRNFIGIEKDDTYFNIAKERIEEHLTTASTQYDEENGVNAVSGVLD